MTTTTVYTRPAAWTTAYRLWPCPCGRVIRQRRGESAAAWQARCRAHAVLQHDEAPELSRAAVWRAGEDVG